MLTLTQPNQLTPTERNRLENIEGIVFDVQRYSVHDGPGLRTNVFLKGCPLRCGWCANPESQQPQPELALSANNCIKCGQFAETCPVCWGKNRRLGDKEIGKFAIDPNLPIFQLPFAERAVVCPTGAIHWIGERRTAGEVIKEVRRDTPFYADGGGMTLTGGEPTMQPDLAEALLQLAKAEGISTAMETCGHTQWVVWERLYPYLDDILFDVKHVDNETHLNFTGIGNELILSNLRQLVALNISVTVRVPLIPGFNASRESIEAIAGLVRGLNGSVKSIDLLPYHTLGKSKYTALSKAYPWEGHNRLTKAEIERLVEVAETCGMKVRVGG